MAKKSMFSEKQLLEVIRTRKISRSSALKFLNREHVGKSAPAVAEAPKAELNFNPQAKSYDKTESPVVEAAAPAPAPKAKKVRKAAASKGTAPEAAPAGVSAAGVARRVSGTQRFNVAGRPTREQIELVYGPKSFAMTWPQREALGVSAEQFQAKLAELTGAAATK